MSRRDLPSAETDVKGRNVQEDGDKSSLEEEAEVTHGVDHALLSEGQVASLADHEVSPLDAHDGHKVASLGELKCLSRVTDRIARDNRDPVDAGQVLVIRIPAAVSVGINTSDGRRLKVSNR